MRLVPQFHADMFALAVKLKLTGMSVSYAGAVERHPYLNKAMLSRAVTQQPLSVPSFLALCMAFDLEPMTYMRVAVKENQTVTGVDTRETRA